MTVLHLIILALVGQQSHDLGNGSVLAVERVTWCVPEEYVENRLCNRF